MLSKTPSGTRQRFEWLEAVAASKITRRALAVAIQLFQRSNGDLEAYPSVGETAKRLNTSTRTTQRAITELIETGWLTVGIREGPACGDQRNRLNLYHLERPSRHDNSCHPLKQSRPDNSCHPSDGQGVTDSDPRGDSTCPVPTTVEQPGTTIRRGVPRTAKAVRTPSKKPGTRKAPDPEGHTAIVAKTCELCGIDSTGFASAEWSRHGQAIKSNRATIDAYPTVQAFFEDFEKRATVYREKFEGCDINPAAVFKHWSEMTGVNRNGNTNSPTGGFAPQEFAGKFERLRVAR